MNRSIQHGKKGSSALYLAALALSSTLIVGCSSPAKVPDQALQAAELAIQNAERERVADYASPELGSARDKLSAARTAVANEKMVAAERLAEQARADAELATAKAAAAKAQEVNEDMKKNINALEQELQRNSGGTQ